MATSKTAVTPAEDEGFADGEVMTAAEVRAFIASQLPEATQATLQRYEEVSDERVPMVNKAQLLGQPYVVFAVSIIEGAARLSQNADDLVFVYAQAVRLDGDGNITKTGKHFMYDAGDTASVHGGEMLSIRGSASPTSPVLIAHGLREVDAALGSYFTVRPDNAKVHVNLFDD